MFQPPNRVILRKVTEQELVRHLKICRRHNAERIWLDVSDGASRRVSVISFWVHAHYINRRHIARVRDVFHAQSGVSVDFYDKPHTLYIRARPGHARR